MNQLIKSKSGKNHLIIRKIGLGGQGEAMECLEQTQKTRWVLKLYHPRFITKETKKRLYWLVRQRLSSRCPILKAPEDIYDKFKSNKLGHFTPMIPGQSLEEFLQNPVGSMIEKLKIALAITHAVDILHNLGIAHGDLQSNNILLVLKNGSSGFEVFIIDFDNFYVRGLPPPSCSGHKLYMPPECRNGGIPFIKSDLFNLAVIMHELILLMHIATGFDSDEKQFEATMISGVWQHDPMFTQANQKTAGGGYPADILNADLMRLFRHGISRDPKERPTAREWKDTLTQTLTEVFICPNCHGPALIDASKIICPICHQPYPTLTLTIKCKQVPLTEGAVILGRNELGGSPKTSLRHVIIRRIGPEYWLEDISFNGTYRWNGTTWVRLPKEQPVLIQKGDRLLFANIEGKLI